MTVFNQISLDILTNAYDLLSKKIIDWIHSFILMIPNFLTATLVFTAFLLFARMVKRVVKNILSRTTISEDIINIIAGILHVAIILVGVFFCLGILQLDKTVTSLLAGAGIIGLALSFAFQDIAVNFISGFIIAVKKPFKVNDLVETNGYLGTITDIDIRSIYLKTFSGQNVIIPSKDVLQKPIINYTTHGERRVEIPVGVSYAEDLERAASIAKEAVEEIHERDKSRPVEVFYERFGDSSVNFILRFWLGVEHMPNFMQARHEAVIAIHKAYRKNNITIPFPIRTLDFGIKGGQALQEIMLMQDQGIRILEKPE